MMPCEVIIVHNLRTDCVRESVKASSDSQDSKLSDDVKNGWMFENFGKMQVFDFSKAIFWEFSGKFKKFLLGFPVSFFEVLYGLDYV